MTVTSDGVRPRATLTWNRSTAPDSFTILRNGVVIASELSPTDVIVNSTTYTWVDPAPLPNVAATYQAVAIVNGKGSSGNATATTTVATMGIWLANLDRTAEVVLTGRDSRTWTYGEQSEVLEVIGSQEVVVVTHAQRGIEGTATGQLRSNAVPGWSASASAAKNALLNIKAGAASGQQCWLTAGDMTIPVVVRLVNITPRTEPTLAFDVSFEFYQVGSAAYTATPVSGQTVVDENGIPYFSTSS